MKRLSDAMNHEKKFGVIAVLVLIVVSLSIYFLPFWLFSSVRSYPTRIELIKNANDQEIGFYRDKSIYIDGKTNEVLLTGNVTVDGSALLRVVSDHDERIIYEQLFSEAKNQKISIDLQNVIPNSYYTLILSSEDAAKAELILESEQSLVAQPDKPIRDHNE